MGPQKLTEVNRIEKSQAVEQQLDRIALALENLDGLLCDLDGAPQPKSVTAQPKTPMPMFQLWCNLPEELSSIGDKINSVIDNLRTKLL